MLKIIFSFLILTFSFTTLTYGQNIKVTNVIEDEKYFIKILEDSKNLIDPSSVSALVSIDNKIITDILPIIENGHSLIPMSLFEKYLNMELHWDNDTRKIAFDHEGKEITLAIGSKTSYIGGKPTTISVAPKIINSRAYIPVRFAAEILGYSVEYNTDLIKLDDEILNFYQDLNNDYIPVINIESKNKAVINYKFETKNGLKTYISKLKPFSKIIYDKNELFIFNNFPERILGNSFAETYINQTNDVTDSTRVFASHANSSKENIDYVIRIENTSNENISLNYVFDYYVQKSEAYPSEDIKNHTKDFFTKLMKQSYSKTDIPIGEKKDFVIKNIPDNRFFTSQLDFEASNKVKVTSFILKSDTFSDDVITPKIPYDFKYIPKTYTFSQDSMPESGQYYTTYSGYSSNYSISAKGDIKVSEMYLKNKDSGVGFETGATEKNLNELNGLNEILDVTLFEPAGENNEITEATWILNVPYEGDDGNEKRNEKNRARNYCNLGNWGIQYNISTNIENDTKEDKLLTLNLVAPNYSIMVVEADNRVEAVSHNNTKYNKAFFREHNKGYDVLDNDKDVTTWEVLEILVPAGETKTVNYKYVLGTDCMATVYHLWEEAK